MFYCYFVDLVLGRAFLSRLQPIRRLLLCNTIQRDKNTSLSQAVNLPPGFIHTCPTTTAAADGVHSTSKVSFNENAFSFNRLVGTETERALSHKSYNPKRFSDMVYGKDNDLAESPPLGFTDHEALLSVLIFHSVIFPHPYSSCSHFETPSISASNQHHHHHILHPITIVGAPR